MSEPIREAIPTSADRHSQRATKKRALTPSTQQSAQVEALFANPEREIRIPTGPQARTVAAPPEIVANVQGSSAGAGSGEFHVYKASRRREYERLRLMDEEVERERKNREFEERRDERSAEDQRKLGRNQAKRLKMKARKERAEMFRKNGQGDEGRVEESGANGRGGGRVKTKLGPAKVVLSRDEGSGAEGAATTTAEDEHQAGNGEGGGIVFHDDD